MEPKNIMQYEPYTYVVVKAGMIGWPTCNIMFDKTVIRELTMPLEAVVEMVRVLNNAYQVGYMEGQANLHG